MRYSPDPKLLRVQSGLQFNIITRTANLNIQIFWDVTSWRTGGANLLRLQGEAASYCIDWPWKRLGVSVLASGTQIRGFKPGRSRRIFKGGIILSTPSFGREVKPWVSCRRLAACKRSLNVPWKSAFRQNSRSLFSAHKFQLPPLECGTRR
jgi:hypothetical protein